MPRTPNSHGESEEEVSERESIRPLAAPFIPMPAHAAAARALRRERPELGHLAKWSVSSHKYGYGVENLKDGNEGTFWQ
jgi:hypothetical protein